VTLTADAAGVTTPAAPQSAPATDSAPATPSVDPTTQSTPVPSPPPNQPAGESKTDAGAQTLTLTQERLDQIIGDRLGKAQKTWQQQQAEQQKKLAAALGITDPDEPVDPAKALEETSARATAAEQRADRAEAKALALAAGVNPKRIDTFIRLVDHVAALKDVDRADEAAVTTALAAAVNAELEAAPEFKAGAGPVVPSSSGGDRTGAAPATVTLEAFRAMDVGERTKLYQSNPGLYKQLADQTKKR